MPRESLLDALRKLRRFSTSPNFDRLIWPDGRRIHEPQDEEDDLEENGIEEAAPIEIEAVPPKADLIPVDSTYTDSFPLILDFEPDEGLREYELGVQKLDPPHSETLLKDGRYRIEGIELKVSLQPWDSRWFGESPLFVCLEFEAAHKPMGSLFYQSSSMRRFFDDLAVELGAALCTLDCGYPSDYIMVDRYKYEIHPGWFSDFDVAEDFEAAVQVSPYLTRAENRLQQMALYCGSPEREFTRLLLYTRESESNLRARAYHALNDEDADLVATVLKAGLDDEDWRVRAVVANRLSFIGLPIAEAALLKALQDPHPEVCSVACEKLLNFDSEAIFEALLDIVENAPLTPLNLGLFRNALKGLCLSKVGWNAADVVEKRLGEPNFPFPNEAARAIELVRKKA